MHRLLPVLALLALAACSSLNIDTANRIRSLDYVNDDLASLLIAFDLPYGLNPVDGSSVVSFDVATPASGEKHLKAVLERAELDDVTSALPPPASNRVYFLFGFSEKDKAALRDIQAWARTLPQGGGTVSVALEPGFCAVSAIDPGKVNVSVLVALPGETALAPLVSNQKLSDMLNGKPLQVCS